MKTDPVELWHKARLGPRKLVSYQVWRHGHWHALRLGRRSDRIVDEQQHLRAAAEWLARAQDATPDGGVVGRYRLKAGWSSSYPETTGYIVPTFLALADRFGAEYERRAARCIEFLLATQLPDGAFPGGEIAANLEKPSPFNTGQILNGLLSWHVHAGDAASLEAARRAGTWLTTVQDPDGAWRKYYHRDIPACYSAHLGCFLAALGAHCDDRGMLDSAGLNIDWILAQRAGTNGWMDRTAFSDAEQKLRIADLHTIAYTLAGMLQTAEILGREDTIETVVTAARNVGATFDRLGWLPGVLDHEWRSRADSACLTGNVQMALLWMRLFERSGEEAWLDWAYRAIEVVKRAQLLDSPAPALRGGIPGPSPMWGWYNDGAVLNWSAKFFIDALLRKAAIEAAR